MRELRTEPLTAERVAQAFPLIQTSLPQVTLDEWRDFAATLVFGEGPRECGIMLVVGEGDCINGLCSYRIERDLIHGLMLSVDYFLAFDLFDRRAVVHALAAGVEALARQRRCTAVHTHVIRPPRAGNPGSNLGAQPIGDGGVVDVLSTRGHRIEALSLCKRLTLGTPGAPTGQPAGA